MYNKKVLSQVDLGKYKKPNPYKNDIIVDPRGQWDYPGQNTRIPGGNITMQGVGYPVWAQPNVGPGMMMMPGQDYNFPGADYVDEYPQMKKGGMLKLPKMPKPSKKGVLGKAYSRSLEATNKLFTENKLFEKPKSKKRKIFDPNANYQDGGELEYVEAELTPEEIQSYRDGGYIVEDISVPQLTQAQGGGSLASGMLREQIKQSKNAPKKPLVVDNPRLGPTKQSNQGSTSTVIPNNKLPQTLNKVRDPEAERKALDRQVRELVQSGAASRSLGTLGSSDKSLYEQTKDALLTDPNFLNKVEKNEYKYQQELEQKAYDDASYLQRGVNFGTALLSNPLTTGANLLEGYRPLMNQAEVLRDPSNPQNVLMRNTGGLDDVFNMFNPGSYVANYNSNVKKGDYSSAALDAADILLAPTGLGRADNATDLTSAFRSLADDGKKLGVKAGSYFPEYKNVYRVEPTTFVKDADDQLSGRWMGELDQMPFYVKNLKDPEGGVRIMRQKMPVKKWQSMSGHNMPFNAKLMSAGTGDYKTLNNAVTAGELSPEAAKRLSVNMPSDSDWEEITFNPKLINLSEGIVPESLADKLRTQRPNRFLSSRDLIEYPAGDLGREGAINHLLNIKGDVEKPILGVPRKYFPFADGGDTDDYIETELTPEEIKFYKDNGYTIEEFSEQEKFGPGGATDLNPQTMTRYLADLKNQENSGKKGFRNNKWYPHSSVEGGADTIAYGHKLTPADAKYYQGITNEQAEALQQQDVLKKQSEAQTFVDKKYGPGAFDRLPQDAQMLLVDYQYNVGLQKFPSFVDATIKGDKARMMKEYERGSSAGKLVKRNKWTKSIIDNLDFTAPPVMVAEVPPVPLANVADATVVVPQVTPTPLPRINPVTGLKYQTGGDVISENGWDYQREGDQYLARKTGTETWIPAQGNALAAIQEKIYKEPIAAEPSATNDPLPVQSEVAELQKKLKAAGYNLGNFGPNKDGVDGQMGNRTKLALDAFNAGVPPSKVKTPDPKQKVRGQVNVYKVNENLREGYLPYLNPNEEVCVKGKGCSANVSIKMSNLLGNITDESLWANDAWFNKSDILNKGGDLIYENQERDYSKMQKVPKDVWSKLQVGDYVQLNRANTKSSDKFAAQSKPGLENEGIEHLGFVVGKDKDGTPLIWHGSETGKAYVQRIDQPLALHDENQISNSDTFTYQVASIVRSPALKNADLSGLQNSAYYTPLDTNKKLVPKKGATSTQVDAIQTLNNSNGAFKNIGYSQDDVNYVGQILIGGIMNNETSAGESNKRVPKEIAATIWKNYLGQGSFEGDEASIGYYQMKPHLNFTNKDGSLNAMGKKLEKLGISIDEIDSDDVNAQTKAGTLLLLNAYDKLKKDKDFNPKTGLYKGKIPASYILAKTWQAGQGWYKRDKYQKYLDNFDVDYSNNALKGAVNSVDFVGSNSPLNKDYYRVNKGIEERNKKIEEAKLAKIRKERAELNKFDPDEYLRSKNQVAESTAVRPIYNQMVPKFDTVNKLDPSKTVVSKTVYTFPGKSGVTYKKDNKGNWYANTGKGTSNKYVPIKDPNGARTKALNSKAIVKAKEGGIVTSLSQNEIDNYLRNGYIIEELD